MDSSQVLVQAASGLERLMTGSKNDTISSSVVAQISAAIYYKASVVSKLTTSKEFQDSFHTVVFNQIQKDFGEYIDSQARMKPQSLHHVYEWKKVGNANARLFQLNQVSTRGLNFKMTYGFLPSQTAVPTNYGKGTHVFKNKATVMKAGFPVRVSQRTADRLVFEIQGSMIFMPKGQAVTIKNPGGKAARNQFSLAYARFFSGQLVNLSIKKSGFQRLFRSSVGRALSLPSEVKSVRYSFSPNTLKLQAQAALSSSFGGN